MTFHRRVAVRRFIIAGRTPSTFCMNFRWKLLILLRKNVRPDCHCRDSRMIRNLDNSILTFRMCDTIFGAGHRDEPARDCCERTQKKTLRRPSSTHEPLKPSLAQNLLVFKSVVRYNTMQFRRAHFHNSQHFRLPAPSKGSYTRHETTVKAPF